MPSIGMTHILDLVNAMYISLGQGHSLDWLVSLCHMAVVLSQYCTQYMWVQFGQSSVIPEGIDLNGFADDHNIKKSFRAGK